MTTESISLNHHGDHEMDMPDDIFTDQAVYIRTVREGISGAVVKQHCSPGRAGADSRS